MSRIRRAAAVILTRESEAGPEVYLVRRADSLSFFGGYWAFPGGALNPTDSRDMPDDLDAAFVRCATRELIEEIGVDLRPGEPGPGPETLCTLTTPAFIPVRFETRFLTAALPDGQSPEPDGGELVDGRFVEPESIIAEWEAGAIQIAPPVLYLLRLLAEHGIEGLPAAAHAAQQALESGTRLHAVYFSPGIFMAPLETPTLPPATTTNTLVVGREHLYLVDPATPSASEQQRLFAEMDRLIAAGARFEAILLTHHHADHVGAVNAVSGRYALPVRAHALTYERIAPGFMKGAALADGDRIELGTAPDGSAGWHLRVLHTPGHAVDHLCFIDSRYNAAIVGDMLSTVSTILIDPPEGHMRTYLDSLARLLHEPMGTLYPAHGPAHRDGHALIREFIAHRADRESQALQALSASPTPVETLVEEIYTDVPREAWPLAARSLLAELIKLEEDGRCERTPAGWRLSPAGAD